MSYRIALGFRVDFAEHCVVDPFADMGDIAVEAEAEDAKVLCLDTAWRDAVVDAGKQFLDLDITPRCRIVSDAELREWAVK